MNPMRTITVGQPLQPGVTNYEETSEYNYRDGSHRLIILLRHPRNAEVKAVRQELAEFAFTVIGPVLVFQHRFGNRAGMGLPWGDALYTWHRLPYDERVPAAVLTGQQRVPLEIILVDAATGIVKALRVVSLSPEFSALLHEAIREQAAAPATANYGQHARMLLESYTTDQLLDQARARCIGGSD